MQVYQMDEVQQEYRQQLSSIISLNISSTAKIRLLENLINTIKEVQDASNSPEIAKYRANYEILSTSISDCSSLNVTTEKDVQEMEERILKMRMVKIENNDEIETMEEQLFEMEKVVKARLQYNDFLKKHIDMRMFNIQNRQEKEKEKSDSKQKSVLNKSLDAVAGVLKISSWWVRKQ